MQSDAVVHRDRQWLVAALAIGICLGVGALGGLATSTGVGSWYTTIERPSWNPPGWVFGPVWTTLYVMMGVAYFLVWRRIGFAAARRATVLFGIQLALNLSWSFAFFALQNPTLALINIALLGIAIAATALEFRKHSKGAALLLMPYLFWVSFASVLNGTIVCLNS